MQNTNGLANQETTVIRTFINDDPELIARWREIALETLKRNFPERTREVLSVRLRHEVQAVVLYGTTCLAADLLYTALSKVDWLELASLLLDDVDERQSDTVDIVDCYSRAEALADGVLVDASKLAVEAGFKYPVAFTSAAWAECVTVPDESDDQDEIGRLWDVLNVLRSAIRNTLSQETSSEIRFTVSVRTGEVTTEDIDLKALCGPGDDDAPVITIMLPNED